MRALFACLALAGIILGAPAAAFAQSARTWVSTAGDDVNSCARDKPCRTFSTAMTKTAAGGEINCVDSGNFGVLDITKSLTVDCRAARATVTTTNVGIYVHAGAGSEVVVRGVDVQGFGSGDYGAYLFTPRVVLDDVRITGARVAGIYVENGDVGRVVIANSQIYGNYGGGVLAKGAGATLLMTLTLDNVQAAHNVYGVRIEDNVRATISKSSLVDNTNNGLLVYSVGRIAIAWVNGSEISNNGINGVVTSGANANVRLAYSSVVGNANGLNTTSGGLIASTSPATNVIYGNASMNTAGTNLPLQ